MDKSHLLKTAEQLQQVSAQSASEFCSKRDHLIDLMNQKMLARPDLISMVGEGNVEMMKDNHANHARFLESIFKLQQADVLLIPCCGFLKPTVRVTLLLLIGPLS